MCSKCGLPFIAWSNANKVVGSLKVDLGEDSGMVKAIKEVWDEWQWIMIFFGDSIEAMPVDA